MRQELKSCKCGHSYGGYVNYLHLVYGGKAVPLGITWDSLCDALIKSETNDNPNKGSRFTAFVIPYNSPRVKQVKTKKKAKEIIQNGGWEEEVTDVE